MPETKSEAGWRKLIPLARFALCFVGLLGAWFHAFPLHQTSFSEDVPDLDAVEIGWLGLAAVGLFLPGISKISLGSVALELKEEARESALELRQAIEDYANLVQNWSSSSIIYVDMIQGAKDDTEQNLLLQNYIRDRMGEAKGFLSEEPSDEVRIALWLYDPESDSLEFFFSNEQPPIKQSYKNGEGMIGQAFYEGRRFNEPDVRRLPAYLNTREGDPPYRAVLCVPVSIRENRIGMLTADKKSAEIFGASAEDVARGLAAQCALAIDQYRRQPTKTQPPSQDA